MTFHRLHFGVLIISVYRLCWGGGGTQRHPGFMAQADRRMGFLFSQGSCDCLDHDVFFRGQQRGLETSKSLFWVCLRYL